MSSIIIRTVKTGDAPAISTLTNQLGYTMTTEQTTANIHTLTDMPHSAILVADENGMVCGWLQVDYKCYMETGTFCEIVGLVVDEQQRGKGIGKMLIEGAKNWSRNRNAAILKVRTNVKRTDTHRFYAAQGFTCIKEQKVFILKL